MLNPCMVHSWVSQLKTLGESLSWWNVLLGLVSGGQVVECQNIEQSALAWKSFHQPFRTSLVALSLWYERLAWTESSLQHPHFASLSASSFP